MGFSICKCRPAQGMFLSLFQVGSLGASLSETTNFVIFPRLQFGSLERAFVDSYTYQWNVKCRLKILSCPCLLGEFCPLNVLLDHLIYHVPNDIL